MRSDELIPFLRLIPSLQSLHLEFYGFDDGYFRAFTHNPTAAASLNLPHLRFLTLADLEYDFDVVHAQDISVVELAESVALCHGGQNPAFSALESVTLSLAGPEFAPELESRLAVAAKPGVVSFTRTAGLDLQ